MKSTYALTPEPHRKLGVAEFSNELRLVTDLYFSQTLVSTRVNRVSTIGVIFTIHILIQQRRRLTIFFSCSWLPRHLQF
ncbi:MAG: hypothetical protein DSM106950_43455 [Stigonema ocellatum SAG 48.90 = DSM 106950]|nr:hypothetical protein [Stigonema ocellatum SAG 48.90 = DSM 106950]